LPEAETLAAAPKEFQWNRRQRKIIEHLKEEGRISRRQYAKMTGVSDETAKRDLAKLLDGGVLNVHRTGRSTFYTLIGSHSGHG
jgi:DeoR/GlpR family transcriptional regulator of sugar metabolism